MTTKYTHDTERFLRVQAQSYRTRNNQQMARNFEMCAEDVKRLHSELAALKEAAKGLLAIHKRHKCLTVYSEQDYRDIWSERVDALAALVGEEGK